MKFIKNNISKIQQSIFYLMLLFLSFITSIYNNITDYDLWARLAVGSLFFQTGSVLKQDIFAYTQTKPIWFDHEWLSGVIFFFFTEHWNDIGLLLFRTLVIFSTLVLIKNTIALKTNVKPGLFYFVLFAFSTILVTIARAQLFSILFFTLWIYVLERIKKGETRLIWIIPATMPIWVNTHGAGFAGIGLLLAYIVGEFINKLAVLKTEKTLSTNHILNIFKEKTIITIFAGLITSVVLGLFCNPYGIKFASFIQQAISMHRPLIIEWQPFYMISDYFYLYLFGKKLSIPLLAGQAVFILLAVASFIKLFYKTSWKTLSKIDFSHLFITAITLYLSLAHKRFTVFFIICCFSLFYPYFLQLLKDLKFYIKENYHSIEYKIFIGIKKLLKYTFILTFCLYSLFVIDKNFRLKVSPNQFPVGSVEFIKQNKLKGNLASTFNWGSFLLWELYPQNLVSVDGRYEEVYSNKEFWEPMSFSDNLGKSPEYFLEKYHTNIILLSKEFYKPIHVINKFKGWSVIYQDPVSLVLVPTDKVKSSYIKPNPLFSKYQYKDLSKHVQFN